NSPKQVSFQTLFFRKTAHDQIGLAVFDCAKNNSLGGYEHVLRNSRFENKSKLYFPRVPPLNDALRQHRISNFHKTCNISSFNIVYIPILLGSVLYTLEVDLFHDRLQLRVYLLSRPAEALRILRHFQSRNSYSTRIGRFPGPE